MVAGLTKQANGQTSVYGTHITNDTSYIDAFIYANGGALLNNEKTKVRFDEEHGRAGLRHVGPAGQGRPGLHL